MREILLFGMFIIPSLSVASLPWPVASTYNSVDLEASVSFFISNLGAYEIPVNLTIPNGCDAVI